MVSAVSSYKSTDGGLHFRSTLCRRNASSFANSLNSVSFKELEDKFLTQLALSPKEALLWVVLLIFSSKKRKTNWECWHFLRLSNWVPNVQHDSVENPVIVLIQLHGLDLSHWIYFAFSTVLLFELVWFFPWRIFTRLALQL